MSRFDGKTAVITGASGGIGESCARKFAAEGAQVVLAARSAEPLRRLIDELGADDARAGRWHDRQRGIPRHPK